MNPTAIRDESFRAMQDRLSGLRGVVLSALRTHGPCDTLALSQRSGLAILTVRPRVTELVQIGFVECVGRNDAGGVYRAKTPDEVLAFLRSARSDAHTGQLALL